MDKGLRLPPSGFHTRCLPEQRSLLRRTYALACANAPSTKLLDPEVRKERGPQDDRAGTHVYFFMLGSSAALM